ncbi:hypothetical protein TNCV_5050481 [Trichonephila clavipes]|nr:hypothetical protein TNCV_5050481 [Trichonephila clavipes]
MCHILVPGSSEGWGRGSSSMATSNSRSHTLGFLPIRHSQGIGASRRCDFANGLSCSSSCCLNSGGTAQLRPYALTIPRRAQACFDMSCRCFEHLPL